MKFAWFAFFTLSIADQCFDLYARQFPSEYCDTYCKKWRHMSGSRLDQLFWEEWNFHGTVRWDGWTTGHVHRSTRVFTTSSIHSNHSHNTPSTTRGYPIDDMSFEDIIDETFKYMSPADQLRWMRGLGWNLKSTLALSFFKTPDSDGKYHISVKSHYIQSNGRWN